MILYRNIQYFIVWSYLDWWVNKPTFMSSMVQDANSWTGFSRSEHRCFMSTHKKWKKTLLTLEKNSKVHFWTICQNIYFVQSIVIWVKLKNHKHLKMMNRFNFLSKIFDILEHIIASKSCHLGSTNLMVRVPTGPIWLDIDKYRGVVQDMLHMVYTL